MENPKLDAFREYMESRGFRFHVQKRKAASLIIEMKSPFSAENVLDLIKTVPRDERVSRPTLFRTLMELTNAQLIFILQNEGETWYSNEKPDGLDNARRNLWDR